MTTPKERMKRRKAHVTPLPRQAVELLRDQQKYSGRNRFVFPSERGGKPLERSGLNNALRTMGLDFTPHDLRATFRTQLVEMGFPLDTIRRQQAHSLGKVDDSYDHAQKLEERAQMLQRWADALDRAQAGKPLKDNVVQFPARTA